MINDFYSSYSSFIISAFLGISIGIIYDVFRIFRIARVAYLIPQGKFYNTIKPKENNIFNSCNFKKIFRVSSSFLTLAEDVIFWILISLAQILFIYHINDGEIRIYFFIFEAIGAVLYFFTVGKLIIYFSVRIIFLIRCLLYWTFYIIIYPIRRILSLLIRFTRLIHERIIKPTLFKIKHKKELKYSEKRLAEILANAESGFLVYRSKVNEKKAKKNIA